MHVCFVLTSPFALNAFVAPVIRGLLASGATVTVVVNASAGPIAADIKPAIEVVDIAIARAISPFQDFQTLWSLVRLFRARHFDIVHSITPKAGLLAMVAARIAGITVRVHTFTGQVWATKRGAWRWLLRLMDKLIARCSTVSLADSASQRNFLLTEGVSSPDRLQVLGQGSIAGVDTKRFFPQPVLRSRVRQELAIPADAVVVLYVGRMHSEKGLVELCAAFAVVAAKLVQVHLLLVGPDEGALAGGLEAVAGFRDRIHLVGLTSRPEDYMAAADIFCLASYREGFGLSLIEAAAAGLPSVASRICGVTDAVVDGVTGLLVQSKDVKALATALCALAEQPLLRNQLGASARHRAERDFSQTELVDLWLGFYLRQSSDHS